ncbi:MAG: cation:proton antiporter [Campylobacteraceae bacterium]|nr:cation:proton antiporter [Campylobacteraceae bacterium]
MENSTGLLVLIFVIGSILTGALTLIFTKGTKVPYTVALLLIGLILGGIERFGFFQNFMPIISESMTLVSNIDPHLILFVFLPTLIFESAYCIEVHLFKRIFSQIAILAIPGLIVSTIATAVLIHYLFPWDWNWHLALMFGALISATDPVAVVAILKEVSSRKRLETLIEGESLFNDGTAIVLFTLFFTMYTSGESSFDILSGIKEFSIVVIFGLALGVIFGYLAITIISKVFNNPLVEISLSIGVSYMVFFLAEHVFHVSGVVALVSLALMFSSIGRTKISPEVEDFLHHFWEMMAYIANTLIFLLVGVLVITRITLDSPEYWTTLFILYIGIMIIRAFSVSLFIPILKRIGVGITKEKTIVLVWGGLRGAVSLALALSVAQSDLIDKEIGDQILFLTAGIVVLTITINGMTIESLLAYLKLNELPAAKEETVQKAKASVYKNIQDFLPKLQNNEFFKEVNWSNIKEIDEYKKLNYLNIESKDISKEELSIEFRRRLLENERKFYWQEFKKGYLSEDATHKLINAIEEALDEYPTITPRPSLEKIWQVKNIEKGKTSFFKELFNKYSFSNLYLSYEIARSFISAQDEVLSHVEQIACSKEDLEQVRSDILKNKENAHIYTKNINKSFPKIIGSIQSKIAKRLLLNKERTVIKELLENGMLAKPEADKMIEHIESKMFILAKEHE